jgi:hypothetical protein
MSCVTKVFGCALILIIAASCSKNQDDDESNTKESGVVGATCYAYPDLRDPQGLKVCVTPESTYPGMGPGEFFYPGIFGMTHGQKTAIQECIMANGLDYGYLAGPGESCAEECKKVTYCIPFSNQ